MVLRAGEPARIEYERVDNVAWTDSTLVVTGVLRPDTNTDAAGAGAVTTRAYSLSELSGVLVREVDADRTSIIIATVGVGTAVIAALLFTGETREGTTSELRGR